MALVTIPGGLMIPPPILSEASFGAGSSAMNALNELEAIAFVVPKTGNLRSFQCRFSTVAVAPGSGLRFSFQANSGGLPSGTPLSFVQSAGGTPAAAGYFDPGAFDADIAVSAGDILFAVVDMTTYTTGSVTPTVYDWPASGWAGFPYGVTNASRNTAGALMISLVYDDATHEMPGAGLWAPATNVAVAINTGTTPDEYGNAFVPTFPCRLKRIWFQITLANQATSVFDAILYDSGNNIISSISRPASTGLDAGPSYWFWDLDTAAVLDAGDLVRAVILPTAAVNVSVSNAIFSGAPSFTAADGGTMLYATQRTDAGSWTNFNNGTDGYAKARIGFVIDQVDDGAGGGGGGTHASAFFG